MPEAIMVAGPNGVGKSTYSRTAFASGFLLLDPDRYGISADVQDPIAAGRLVVRRVYDAIASREDFVLETTLSGRFPLNVLRLARLAGYDIMLVYVGLDDVDECVRRVRERVHDGGHDVPEIDIRRRFARSRAALPAAIKYADRIAIYENSEALPYRLIVFDDRHMLYTDNVPPWARATVTELRSRFRA